MNLEPYIKHLIARFSEADIEESLGNDRCSVFHREAARLALHRIDQLQVRGVYKGEVERLRVEEDIEMERCGIQRTLPDNLDFAVRLEEAFARLMKGLNSSDDEQRTRFEAFFKANEGRSLIEALPNLEVLEAVKARRGAPRGRRYPEDEELLVEMKVLVGQGWSVSAAAREVAPRARGATNSNKAERLEMAFRNKQALRAGK